MTGDPYIDPQTGVLRNRLGITDADELTRVESDLTVVQLVDLWAGELRTVTIVKADLFCLPENIASFSQDVFRALDRDDFLRGRERAEFVVGLAEHLANVNAVHPFREGNGRTQRAFFGQLARDAGYRIDWSTMDRETNLAASRASIRGNEAQLRAMLDRLVDQPGE